MKKALLFFLILCFGVFIYLSFSKPSKPSPVLDDPEEVLLFINKYRISVHQKLLVWRESLCPLASERLKEIQTDFSHAKFIDRKLTVFDYCPKCHIVSENIAEGFFDEQLLVQAWIKSPRHLQNLLLPHVNVCIKVQNGYSVLISSY